MGCLLGYDLSVIGDCQQSGDGSFTVNIRLTPSASSDATIKWLTPFNDVIELGVGVSEYTVNYLSSGYYSFYIQTTCEPVNDNELVTVYISSGNCVEVSSITHTTCGESNGSFGVSASTVMDDSTYTLYTNDGGMIDQIEFSSNLSETFYSLSAGTYYATVSDGYGCTAKTQTCVVKSSSTINYGLYVVNDTNCPISGMGKIYVTGLTGTPPYTYLWTPNGETTSYITGLTSGVYSVLVTDATLCTLETQVLVSDVPPLGYVEAIVTSPSCFQDNGELEIYWSGGSAPYFFSGSNGYYGATFATHNTFGGLSSGPFTMHITDSGLCNFTKDFYLTPPEGFDNVSISTVNASCSNNGGSISIILNGSSKNFTYELEDENGDVKTTTTTSSQQFYNFLAAGSYTLTISGGECVYSETIIIENDIPFNVTTNVTGTTCGQINGYLDMTISGATGPLLIDVSGENIDDQTISLPVSITSTTVTNLSSGFINYIVTDLGNNSCKLTGSVYITNQPTVDFMFNKTNSTCGNGSICVSITNGEPIFTLDWSDNVNGQTGLTVTNLSAGTYSLTVTDYNGCSKYREISIDGANGLSTYQVFNVCDNVFVNTGENIKKGPKEMLLEGYYDLISNDENCVLNSAEFIVKVEINGGKTSSSIYTTTSLDDYPTDQDFYDAVETLLFDYDGIATVTINQETNKITITTNCDSVTDLGDAQITVDLEIEYDISCVSCSVVCTHEFIPINCEITNEYCETTDTKLISPIQYNLFGPDYLDNTEIIPSRCTELPNFYIGDCDGSNDVEGQFRDSLNEFLYYQNQYNLALSEGRVTLADSYPTPLPPSRYTTDYFYDGPDNIGWYKFNILQGCSCKKIFADDGHVGPEYDFEVEFLTEVQSYLDLPLTGVFGQYCFVLDDDIFYMWNPNTNNWVSEGTVIDGYPDADFCLMAQRTQRNAFSTSLDALTLAWRPFTWSTFHAPLYQIFKYKF